MFDGELKRSRAFDSMGGLAREHPTRTQGTWGDSKVDLVNKLAIVTLTATAVLTGTAMAQTVNNAPQNSPVGVQDQMKQAPRTGDTSQVGGTPSATFKGKQSQIQDRRTMPER